MKNEHMYKKLKYELTLSYLYNIVKYTKPNKQTLWSICKYFNVEFNNQRYNTVSDFAYNFSKRMRNNIYYLCCNAENLMYYANAHHISIYDMKEHEIINSVYNILV